MRPFICLLSVQLIEYHGNDIYILNKDKKALNLKGTCVKVNGKFSAEATADCATRPVAYGGKRFDLLKAYSFPKIRSQFGKVSCSEKQT